MFLSVSDVFTYLSEWAPLEIKEKTDNVGLLVGRQKAQVSKIIVSPDITEDVISEAIETGANLIVAHHPLFFSLSAVNDSKSNFDGQKVLTLAESKIAAICMHTNVTGEAKYHLFLDAKQRGINLIEAGHFCTENVISQVIAERLSETFPKIDVTVSKSHGQVVKSFS